MLPSNPELWRRLLRAARVLLDWSPSQLASEAGVSTAAVHAVECGRLHATCPAAVAIIAALERCGVQFIPPIGQLGPGLRYTPPGVRVKPAGSS
jgi:DNA-binding XRE family transcriptional regulator